MLSDSRDLTAIAAAVGVLEPHSSRSQLDANLEAVWNAILFTIMFTIFFCAAVCIAGWLW